MRKLLVVASAVLLPLLNVVGVSSGASPVARSVTTTPISTVAYNPSNGYTGAHVTLLPTGHLLVNDTVSGDLVEMNIDGSNHRAWTTNATKLGGMSVFVKTPATGSTPAVGYVYVAVSGNPGKILRFDLTGLNVKTAEIPLN